MFAVGNYGQTNGAHKVRCEVTCAMGKVENSKQTELYAWYQIGYYLIIQAFQPP